MYEIKYRKADEMKDSGIEWLGMIPEDWKVIPLKFAYKYSTGATPSSYNKSYYDENGYKWVTISDLHGKYVTDTNTYISKKAIRDTNIILNQKGSLLYSFKLSVGQVAFLKENMYTNEAIAAFNLSNKNDLKYLYYIAPIFIIKNAYENIYGAKLLNQSLINNAKILLPNIIDQHKIANFLDIKIAQFDSIIAKKELLIEKLEEAKKSLISEVVTGKVKIVAGKMVKRQPEEMKDSGVEWLGMMPKDWILGGFTKYLQSIVDYRGKTPEKVEEGIFLVTAKNIKNSRINYNLSREYVKRDKYREIMSRGIPHIGDVLFTTEAPLGEVANVDNTNIALAQRVIKFSGKPKILNNYFLKYFIFSNGFQQNLKTFATGSTATGIKASKLTQLKVLLPPFDEQLLLVRYLDIQNRNIEKIIKIQIMQIQKLQQAKQSLISEAVTGKIDLRDWEIIEEGELE